MEVEPAGGFMFPFLIAKKKNKIKTGLGGRERSHFSVFFFLESLRGRDRGQSEHSVCLSYIRKCVSAGLVSSPQSFSLATLLKKAD